MNKEEGNSKKEITFFPSDLVARHRWNFNKVVAGHTPVSHESYVRMELIVPWPADISRRSDMSEEMESRFSTGAASLQKAFDYAINGLRREDSKFTIEVPVSHELNAKRETNISIFIYSPENDKQLDVEVIKNFFK